MSDFIKLPVLVQYGLGVLGCFLFICVHSFGGVILSDGLDVIFLYSSICGLFSILLVRFFEPWKQRHEDETFKLQPQYKSLGSEEDLLEEREVIRSRGDNLYYTYRKDFLEPDFWYWPDCFVVYLKGEVRIMKLNHLERTEQDQVAWVDYEDNAGVQLRVISKREKPQLRLVVPEDKAS